MIPSENVMPIMFVVVSVLCGPVALAVYFTSLELRWRRWHRDHFQGAVET
jgi:hypothetical protein